MKTNILTIAIALSDQDLLARIDALAGTERETTAELVAHLAALELRPSLYLAQGYGSLFDYCTEALRLSEDAACNRIQATRACRRFPAILDLLATGSVSLRSVRVLGPHLTVENHMAVLARAANRRRGDIDALVAELSPKPDVVASVRKVPVCRDPGPSPDRPRALPSAAGPGTEAASGTEETSAVALGTEPDSTTANPAPTVPPFLAPTPHAARPIIKASAPNRFRVQLTIGQQAHDDLRRLQALLRREIPTGDPAEIVERALALLRERVEKAKLGETTRPRQPAPGAGPTADQPDRAYGIRIRPGADKPSRHIPNAVKRVVWRRDGGQCAFVAMDGRGERAFLELHHIHPYALDGAATVHNISLRCRRHNAYEAERIFGPRGAESERPVLRRTTNR